MGKSEAYSEKFLKEEAKRVQAREREAAQQVRDMQRTLKKNQARTEELEKILDVVTEAELHSVKPHVIPPAKKHKHDSESAAIAVLSDVHAGEVVKAAQTNGRNEFNLEICEHRLQTFARKAVSLTNIERTATKINTMVLALLGDLMVGHIHQELQETAQGEPLTQMEWVQSRILGVIDYILKEGKFERLVIPCCVGNHGRTTKKMHYANSWAQSYEGHIYRELSERYKGDKRVEVIRQESVYQYVTVFNTRFRFWHGENLNYLQGVLGPAVPLGRIIGALNRTAVADYDVLGHLHQYVPGHRFTINGSLIGYNAYAAGKAFPYEPPIQAFMVVNRDYGVSCQRPIYLSE